MHSVTMTKHQFALKIARKLYRGSGLKERFNAYQRVQRYVTNLSIEDLHLIATRYGLSD